MKHFLGGSDGDKRSLFAIPCTAHNVVLALFIAVLNDVEQKFIPILIVYLILE